MAITKKGYFLAGTINGVVPSIRNYRLLAVTTATVYEGTPLTTSTVNGRFKAVTQSTDAVYGVLGCTVTPQTYSSTAEYPVYLADDVNVFLVESSESTTPSAQIGQPASIVISTTGDFTITFADPATACMRVVDTTETAVDTAKTGAKYVVKFTSGKFGG